MESAIFWIEGIATPGISLGGLLGKADNHDHDMATTIMTMTLRMTMTTMIMMTKMMMMVMMKMVMMKMVMMVFSKATSSAFLFSPRTRTVLI